MDQVLVRTTVPTAPTIRDLGIRGILLNPNATDTDFDGLADGQELYVKSVKTPKRYPMPDLTWTSADPMLLPISAPGWALASATLMTGITHPDMGQLEAKLLHFAPSPFDRDVTLRSYANVGQANNFTSYDLLNLGYMRDEFPAGGTWVANAYDGASGKTGQIEYYQIQVTLHTLPNRADTDLEALNDSEELNLGSDGYATNPWKTDTDGDAWSDGYETLTRGTNPLSNDTDGDGVRDSSDLDPLRNLLVAVRVNYVHHGADPWCSPELLGIIRVNDDYTWVSQHKVANLEPFTSWACPIGIPTTQYSTAYFGYTYYADVPDDVSPVSLRATAWAINPGRGDDILVDQFVTYFLNSGTLSQTLWNGNSWYTFDVWTVALPKAKTFFITDGNATVTVSNGQSRLVGQDRYYVFTFDVTSAYGPFVVGVNAIVVPRSIFLDSKLRADFDGGTFAPLTYATLYGEDLGQSRVSESVAGTIAVSLSGYDAYNVLTRLLRNSTNVQVYSYVDVTSHVLLVSLPSDVVRILPWQSVSIGPTGAMPADFWQKIGAAASAVVNTLVQYGQMLYDGLVALGTFLVNLAEAIVDWGMRELGRLWEKVQQVAQKAGEVLGQFVSAIVAYIMEAVHRIVDPVISAIKSAITRWIEGLRGLIHQSFVAHSPVQTLGDYLSIFSSIWSYMLTPILIVAALVVIAQAIDVIIQVASVGIASVLGRVVNAAVPLFLFGVGAAAIGAVTLSFASGINQLFIDQLGAAGSFISGIADTAAGIFFLIQSALTRSLFTSSAAFSLLSILLATISQTDVWWVNLMLVSFSLALALVGLRDYITGPDEALAKVITPFVSLVTGIAAYSAIVTVSVAIATGVTGHTIIS